MLYLQNSVILLEISSLLLLSPNICSFSHTNAGIIKKKKIEVSIRVANKKEKNRIRDAYANSCKHPRMEVIKKNTGSASFIINIRQGFL